MGTGDAAGFVKLRLEVHHWFTANMHRSSSAKLHHGVTAKVHHLRDDRSSCLVPPSVSLAASIRDMTQAEDVGATRSWPVAPPFG
jgi:hypothetical protein